MSTKTQGHHHSYHAEMKEKPAPTCQDVGAEERFRSIQARAYDMWEQAGKPDGGAARERFWREAEKEIVPSRAMTE